MPHALLIKFPGPNCDAETARVSQAPLQAPVFLNSVPKSGTHLVRNILRMFVAPEQQYQAQFIQFGNLSQHVKAFDPKAVYGDAPNPTQL
jgi:hypothetical protein